MKRPWISLMAGLLAISPAAAENLVTLTGHVPGQVQGATKLERAPADEPVQLSLVVRVDPTLLDQTLADLYGPHAPASRHYLTSSEFAQRFDLANKRQKLKDFAQANGLTIDPSEDNPESMIVKVSAGASVVEKAFSVQLNHYRGSDGRIFRSHETDPLVPASLASHLSAVLGLSNNTRVQHPHIRMSARSGARAPSTLTGTTGPAGTLAPADIKTVYGLSSVALTGTGQMVALFELDGYIPTDLPAYESAYSLSSTPVTFEGVDTITQDFCGVDQNQTCNSATFNDEQQAGDNGMVEVALDLDMVAALASGVSHILVYEGPNNNSGIIDTYNKIATDNLAQVASTSWGRDEQDSGSALITSESAIFQRMATQGQTMYAASGDCGAYDQENSQGNCVTSNGLRVDDPASQPYVTGVGGTSLSGSITSPTETVWNNFSSGGAGGGGVSAVWPLPSYQSGVAGMASQQNRNVPDIALNADPDNSPYDMIVGGNSYAVGGTSAAAPLWAALTALINEQRTNVGSGAWGFANPDIYGLATGSSYSALFRDITSGSNGANGGGFSAHAGYDNTTGWGSFKGSAIIGAPIISSLSPTSVTAAEPAFTLTVNGSNFVSNSSVTWNGSVRATTFVNSSQLQAAISASDIAEAGTVQVAVSNPGSGGATLSNSVNFAIGVPAYETELLNVFAFPNPWDTRHDSTKRMTFANLPSGATVKLFTVSGFLVKTLTASGNSAVWDLTNDSGQMVASGLYFYVASDSSAKVSGKVAIIR